MGDYKFARPWRRHRRDHAQARAKPGQRLAHLFGVDDIDRGTKAITDGGGQTLYDPMEIPAANMRSLGIDPQGAIFGLVGPRKN